MRVSLFAVAAMVTFATFGRAQPATQPTTMPATQPLGVWIDRPLGKLMLRSFSTAPFPHASRAEGWTNSTGTKFGAEHYQDCTVGLFVPKGYTPGETVDLVFYFHGHRNHVSQVIDRYKLEEQLAKSGLNAILVLPQGPLDVPDSAGGKLELDDGGFAKFAADVARFLKSETITTTDGIGHIALATHSGGYKVTASILHRGGMSDRITDVILLDSTYGGLAWFLDFAKATPDARIVSFHTKHLDARNTEFAGMLDKAGLAHREVAEADVSNATLSPRGVTFISTTLPHDDVVGARDFLALCLSTSKLDHLPVR